MILISQIRYRRLADRGLLPQSSFRAPPEPPYTSGFALAFIAVVIVMMGIDKDARISLYCAPAVGPDPRRLLPGPEVQEPGGKAFAERVKR